MRRNVLDWFGEQFSVVSHAVVLTHNIDFLFVQSVLVPRLRAMGQPRLTIFADAMCAAGSYKEQRRLLDGLGVRYRVVPVDLGPGRRFHPKAILLCNAERAAAAIGSGNLTHGGLSANHEAWAFGVSDGDGANLVASLRDYLDTVCGLVPLSGAIRESMDDVFSADHAWLADLPPASGLAMSPSERPLFDQIADLVGDGVENVRLLAPYYDDEGAALEEISRRYPVSVRAYFQPDRAGLSQSAAARLPSAISLGTVISEHRPNAFIHAKVIAFQRAGDVVIAVGSANCSRAALLAGTGWGNAELMAVDVLSTSAAADFFDDLALTEAAPVLPEHPPSDDWEIDAIPALRILAARREADRLEIAFKSAGSISDLAVLAPEGRWSAHQVDIEGAVATFMIPIRLTKVQLTATSGSGETLVSEETWVDDEASLAASASIRRVLKAFQAVVSGQGDCGDAYATVLELYPDYIRDPEAARRWVRQGDGDSSPPVYDPATVFSEAFGRAPASVTAHPYWDGDTPDILSILAAFYGFGGEVVDKAAEPTSDDDDEQDVVAEEARITKSVGPQGAKVTRQLKRALANIEKALCEPNFLEGRRPDLLGADLGLAAILLTKGLADGHLDPLDYRGMTRRLWAYLFFGAGGAPGALSARLQLLNADEKEAFIKACATPRLTGALVLWSLTEWAADDVDGLWFRTSAAQLHSRHPWLFASAAPHEIEAELRLLASSLLPANERVFVLAAWTAAIRAGEALRLLSAALNAFTAQELLARASSPLVTPSDLLWQNGSFAVPMQAYRRESGTKAKVRLLGEAEYRTYKGRYLIPVRDLLSDKDLDLPPLAVEEVHRFMSAVALTGGA